MILLGRLHILVTNGVLLSVVAGFSLSPALFQSTLLTQERIRNMGNPKMCFRDQVVFRKTKSWLQARPGDEEDDEDEDELDDAVSVDHQEDWRSFRAKLVMGENRKEPNKKSSTSKVASPVFPEDVDDLDGIGALFSGDQASFSFPSGASLQDMVTPLDPLQWAYDSGTVIEKGAVILGGVEQDFGFGIRQQYFHKAAILIVDYDESTFTKGIILNRPSDLTLDDDINPGVKWRIWFGGDVEGLESSHLRPPHIICLHSLKSKLALDASVPVIKGIHWTSFDNAKQLVKAGIAQPSDFWVFAGYAGWSAGQLMGELDRKSWYMVATDSGTLLKELARLGAGSDPRDAGLETWDLLMNMIGRGETAKQNTGTFDDLMLKEWALEHLLSTEAGGGAGKRRLPPNGGASTQDLLKTNPVDLLVSRVAAASRGEDVTAGSLVCASSAERSPFLLSNQEFHKSVVLILLDDENLTVGALLNRPTTKGLGMQLTEKETGQSSKFDLPLRHGGPYSVKGSEPLLWLHCNPVLRAAKIGSPFGSKKDGIYKCTAADMMTAVGRNLASPDEFLVVSGVCLWTKGEGGISRGIQGEIKSGKFEVVPAKKTEAVWKALKKQNKINAENLNSVLKAAEESWAAGLPKPPPSSNGNKVPITGLGEGFDEDDDTLVFKSNVKVASLADDALRSWYTSFVLGPSTV